MSHQINELTGSASHHSSIGCNGGLPGDQVSRLTVGEMELLIFAASLYDSGMVYQEEEKQQCYEDAEACRKFLREYCPEYMGFPAGGWKELFGRCPREIVHRRCVAAVCMSHGEDPEALSHNKDLEYPGVNEADPLFCALLLRLGE